MSARPAIVSVPSADIAFRAAIDAVLDRNGIASPAELERVLHVLYPRASVRARDLSAEGKPTWYAYRDGTFQPEGDRGWVRAAGTAWARIDGSGRITAANAALAVLFATPGVSLVGRHVSDFIVADTADISARQLGAIFAGEEVASYGMAPGPDGGTFVVEWVARLDGDEIEAWYRAVPSPEH